VISGKNWRNMGGGERGGGGRGEGNMMRGRVDGGDTQKERGKEENSITLNKKIKILQPV
jgi:hypothetical protein